jgi:CIC family chloride channel protein
MAGVTDVPTTRRAVRSAGHLSDFTVSVGTLWVVSLAVVVGVCAAVVALGLLGMIGLITHLAYFQTVGWQLVAPDPRALGGVSVVIPVTGGLVIGAMAFWGSERIRGHGIPEAMETILVGGSRVEPRLATLKPVSSAVSIGTGGPFGAEGPIILTGGAVGSVLAQHFHLSAIERRTLLVAGACAGMAAVFGTPVAAVLFGVELLVFELKPRSFVPIAVAVTVASVGRVEFVSRGWMQPAPLFPIPESHVGVIALVGAAVAGVACGLLAGVLTAAVYAAEDAFGRIPIHWAWWPALGGVIIGIGGLVDPRVLGVGYSTIASELAGHLTIGALALLLVTKLVVWSVGLGSGTSGGILAPLLMMGAALGGIMSPVLPGADPSVWATLGMAGTMAGVTRSPLTALVFTFELTHSTDLLLPLLLACTAAHLVSTLTLKRSILTEKVARKGFHVVREYAVDPLEALFVRDVMSTDVFTVSPIEPLALVHARLAHDPVARRQHLYPVIDHHGVILGSVSWDALHEHHTSRSDTATVGSAITPLAAIADPDETLRHVADRMAASHQNALPVIATANHHALQGIITVEHLLAARRRLLIEERHRERPLRLRPQRRPPPAEEVVYQMSE